MTDQGRIELAWLVWESERPFVQRILDPTLRALVREAFRSGWLAAELAYRRDPA